MKVKSILSKFLVILLIFIYLLSLIGCKFPWIDLQSVNIIDSTNTNSIDILGPGPPLLSSPHDDGYISDTTPTFKWSNVSDAYNYTLAIDVFTSFTTSKLVIINGIPNNTFTLTSPLAENDMSDICWYWRVCAFDAASNQGPYSSIFSFVLDETPPLISSPSDISCFEMSIGHKIIWYVYEMHPNSYHITRNGMDITSGYWPLWEGNSITLNFGELSVGTYIYNCTVYDKVSFSVSDAVKVTVRREIEDESENGDTLRGVPFGYMFLLFAFIGVISIILMKRRRLIILN